MLLPEKEWYSIEEVAERWGVKQEDIEHYLETRRLWATVRLTDAVLSYVGEDGQYGTPSKHSGRYVIVDFEKVAWNSSDICDLHARSIVVGKRSDQMNLDDQVELGSDTPLLLPADHKFSVMQSYAINKNDLVIMAREVKLFERKCKTSSDADDENCTERNAGIPPYLDPKHPYFSKKLEAAISAWLAMYGSGSFHGKRGHKAEIMKWVENNRKEKYDLSNQAIEAISLVINANPHGGAPSQVFKEE
ncbi:MAG: hypothetical protein EG824_02040 [Deltaproteobacteria bacterium]|nr:hypothetical protein [Deltaproteobacteria bacterium]